jgi:hypothetical protein
MTAHIRLVIPPSSQGIQQQQCVREEEPPDTPGRVQNAQDVEGFEISVPHALQTRTDVEAAGGLRRTMPK